VVTTENVVQRLGEALRAVRLEAGLSQTDVAVGVGVAQRTVSQWEHGADGAFPYVVRLERTLGVPAGTLLRRAGLCGPTGGSVRRRDRRRRRFDRRRARRRARRLRRRPESVGR
jgi:transcriptional regulator with XRE-family HTH domain